MITRQELLEYADTLYELKDSEVVKTYLKALHDGFRKTIRQSV